MTRKKIVILGSTGSIGTQVLECLALLPEAYEVVGLTAHSSRKLFDEQIKKWRPRYSLLTGDMENPEKALRHLVKLPEVDCVINALTGTAGVAPSMASVEAGKVLFLANKESLVMHGAEIMSRSQETGSSIFPLDSEAGALWALLRCEHQHQEKSVVPNICPDMVRNVSKLIITASGGPFYGFSREQLALVSVEDALNHPTWKMGKKITIDSATLMNKAFEMIECHHLFGFPMEAIVVLVNRKSLVHAGVEYMNGEREWVVYNPTMRCPILDALNWYARQCHLMLSPDFESGENVSLQQYDRRAVASGSIDHIPLDDGAAISPSDLAFSHVDESVFPALTLARKAVGLGCDSCAEMSEKNEVAVQHFLAGKIPFINLL